MYIRISLRMPVVLCSLTAFICMGICECEGLRRGVGAGAGDNAKPVPLGIGDTGSVAAGKVTLNMLRQGAWRSSMSTLMYQECAGQSRSLMLYVGSVWT